MPLVAASDPTAGFRPLRESNLTLPKRGPVADNGGRRDHNAVNARARHGHFKPSFSELTPGKFDSPLNLRGHCMSVSSPRAAHVEHAPNNVADEGA
eukprot:1195240-Prorocentrum_minimum.AAC.7